MFLVKYVPIRIMKYVQRYFYNANLLPIAMDCIPRISRAQVFDALSSMSNVAGYRAVIEAANHYPRFLAGKKKIYN